MNLNRVSTETRREDNEYEDKTEEQMDKIEVRAERQKNKKRKNSRIEYQKHLI